MRVVIAGGHGQIARQLVRLLAGRGDTAVGLVRDPAHVGDLEADGGLGVVCDLERSEAADMAGHLSGADAVVFAAGAGPGSGAARKETVDRAAAVLLADAAERARVRRYLMVSAIGAAAEPPPGTGEVFAAYLRAKRAADEDLAGRDLDWTILRPGRLTDEPATGRVALGPDVTRADVPRADVADVLRALLDTPGSAGRTANLVRGDTPVDEAVRRL
jgi:uncharacterized protein YbjT (DUF2867 family)